MSARSRYLEAISPRNENRDDDVNPTASSWQAQNQQPNNNNYTANNNGAFGLKRSGSVKSPSSIANSSRSNFTTNNNNSGAVHAFINKSGLQNNAQPPPPPPPGVPVKRKKNSNRVNNNGGAVEGEEKQTQAVSSNNDNNNASNVSSSEAKSSSPVRAAGEQWSPREEIQSGNVQKYKNMIWGNSVNNNNNNNSAPQTGQSKFDSPQGRSQKAVAAATTTTSTIGRGSGNNNNVGKSPPRTTTSGAPPPPPSSSSSPSRSIPFYKRTAPSPIITTPNRPSSSVKVGGGTTTSTMPTPPSRVGVRYNSHSSPNLPMGNTTTSNNNIHGSSSGSGKPATPLQQRGGSLNISPLVTNFDEQQQQQSHSSGVRSIIGQLNNQSPNNGATPSSPQQQQQQQQQGITTITSFKRPNHKVGIIFTRQSSTSPDTAIIARILPESIFHSHDEAERREQARSAALKGISPSSMKSVVRGLEGAEVIAVNGVPVRNPRHAAEMVAKAGEEVRLSIRKLGEESVGKYVGGVKNNSPVFSPKVPELNDSPQGRQEEEEEEGRLSNNNLARPRSVDEESSFSVRTEEGPEQQQRRKEMPSMVDEMSAVTETEDDGLSMKKESMFAVKKATPKQQSGRGGDVEKDSAAAAAAAKKSKEIADMRRKVAQAMLMSNEMVDDPVADGAHDIDSEEEGDWSAPQQIKKTPPITKKKKLGAAAQSPKSPSRDLAERRRQAALDMYYSQEMVGDNIDDVALGTAEVVGGMSNKETISGEGLPPPLPMKDRISSYGTNTSSVARTDVTTESMATQQMGSTSPKVVASSQSGEEEVFQFEDDVENERGAITSPVLESRRVEREPEEVDAAASAVAAGAKQELQRQRAVVREENVAVSSSKSAAVAPPSPAREVVAESPGRKGLFGKIKSQKTSKMFGGVKNMLKPQKFKKSKAADRGIPLEDSDSSGDVRVDTIETNTARNTVAAVAAPPSVTTSQPATEKEVPAPTEDLFAPPDQSNSWGDDFFKDPFANSPFNDPAKGDPYGFPETERARNGDAFGFDNADSWGEPQTLPDVKAVDSNDNLSHSEMSEITNPSFISRKTVDKKEANFGEEAADSKENYSAQSRNPFGGEQAEAMRSNLFAREQAEAMRTRMMNKKSSPTADPPIDKMETYASSEDDNDDKVVSNLMAKSRIISKYGKNRRRGSESVESAPSSENNNFRTTPPRKNAIRPPIAQSPNQGVTQQEGMNELALAREQAIARQRAIDIAAAKAKQTGVTSSPYSSRGYRNNPRSPTNYSSYPRQSPPRQKKKVVPSAPYNPEYYSVENYLVQVKDPVQRAGVRLLWAAAIPIQTQIRRFLARQHAIRRMCAVLTIQSFVRRWNAERNLEIAVWSAIQIQAAFRGWFARDSLEDNHYCATQIQRITRGYLATMHVFEDLYSITIVQSVVRRFLAINVAVDRLSSIIAIQAWYRGIRAREAADDRYYSAIAIQSTWRRYMCQMTYQFDIIDIIIVQSVVRRKQAIQLRKKTAAVVRIQALARATIARNKFVAAKAMHDLVTRHTSATKIQSCWRSYSAQVKMLMTIVNIIVIQSVWRRRAVEKIYKPHLHRIKLAKERKRYNAATKIQSAWRGFSAFSGYTIIRYENQAATIIQSQWRGYLHSTNYCIMLIEIVRIQALVRGRQERSWLTFQHECASIIQAAMRGYLTRKELHNESMISVLISAAALSLRTRNAARTLQRWWVEEMWKQKQKRSALIIERFFIYVKKEVEKEIKAMKKKKRQRKKMKKYMQSDDWLLENAWQGLEAATSVEMPTAPQPGAAPAVPIPYDNGLQLQHQYQPQHQQHFADNRNVYAGMSPARAGGVVPPSGGAPGMSGPPPQAANYSAHAAANQSIPRNNSIRQQHGYRGRRYDRTDDDSLALDAAFAEASAHDTHLVNNNQYQQRSSSKGYRGRRYN